MEQRSYREYSEYLRTVFPCFKVQKLSINVGFTCPNRDGSKGWGGCAYCNNRSFSPAYTTCGSVTEQLERGKRFFGTKYPNMKYLAYFQSYTNTYGELERLKALYEEALSAPNIVGLVIGTRPDTVSDMLLDYLQQLSTSTFVYLEYGVESTKDATLERIDRGHTYADSVSAIMATHQRGLPIGVHLILGLPGEDTTDYHQHISRLSTLPITSIKLHQLQILKGTKMAREYRVTSEGYQLMSPEEYVAIICQLLRKLPTSIYLDRFVSQSPPELLIAPKWGIKNYQFAQMIEQTMRGNGWRQGDLLDIVNE